MSGQKLKNALDKITDGLLKFIPESNNISKKTESTTDKSRDTFNNKINKYIAQGNYQKLEFYLKNNPDHPIVQGHFFAALEKFGESNKKTISNAYNTIKVLTPKVPQDVVTRLSNNDAFTKKYSEEYLPQKLNRDLLKAIDNAIQKDLIDPIANKKPLEIYDDFKFEVSGAMKRTKQQIQNDPQFRDTSGNLIISEERLNLLIYQRTSLKASTKLHLDKLAIDGAITTANSKTPKEVDAAIERILTAPGKRNAAQDLIYRKDLISIQKHFLSLIPPHLFNLPKTLDLTSPRAQQIIGAMEKSTVNLLASQQRQGLDKEAFETLKHLSNTERKISTDNKYQTQFEEAQKQFYEKITQEAFNAKKNKGISLSEFERQGILILKRKLPTTDQIAQRKELSNRIFSWVKNPPNGFDKEYYNALSQKLLINKALTEKEINDISTLGKKTVDWYATNLSPNLKLKPRTIEQLILASTTTAPLNISEEKLFADFVEYSTDNKELNKRYGKLLNNSPSLEQYSNSISQIHKYSYKTSHMDVIDETSKKIDTIIDKHINNIDIDESDKVSLHDLGFLNKLHNSNDVYNILALVNRNAASDKLKAHQQLVESSGVSWNNIQNHLKDDIKITNGDLVLTRSQDHYAFEHIKPTLDKKIQDIITSYGHAAVVQKDAQNKPIISHMMLSYTADEINPLMNLTNDTLHITPIALMDKNTIRAIKAKKGFDDQQCAKYLEEEYSKVAQELHKQVANAKFQNSPKRQYKAGIASLIPFYSIGKKSVRKWANDILKDDPNSTELISRLAEDSSKKESGEMICSEFAAKKTILSVINLEKKLSKELGIPISIKLPFSSRQDLSKVTPELLATKLKKSGAAKKVELTGLGADLIQNPKSQNPLKRLLKNTKKQGIQL